MEAFGVEDDVELAVDFDDIALPERASDDSHGFPRLSFARMPGHHTDLAALRQRFS
jgi:hypothetical protein